jgi:hypothetical protein
MAQVGRAVMSDMLANEPDIVERILNHIDRKSTDLSDEVWYEPVEHYTSQARFSAELRQVFRKTATPFCPSDALRTLAATWRATPR